GGGGGQGGWGWQDGGGGEVGGEGEGKRATPPGKPRARFRSASAAARSACARTRTLYELAKVARGQPPRAIAWWGSSVAGYSLMTIGPVGATSALSQGERMAQKRPVPLSALGPGGSRGRPANG